MPATNPDIPLEIFSMCPTMNGLEPESYLRQIIDVAQWSEECGCKGILVFSDNSQLDAWSISHLILQHTRTLCPLVAVQPIYMHPYTVAKTLSSIGWLYGRQIYLNMVAGGFVNDLTALNDTTPHDRRYDRLAEYVRVIKHLLHSQVPVTFEGEFYRVDKLKLTPPLVPELFPGIFVSGSSEAGVAAARVIGATAIKYPKPASEETAQADNGLACGIRVGIIARRERREAWDVAHTRFPEDRKGQLTRQLASKVSDSVWHKELTAVNENGTSPYWLVPFQNYKAMCPYLVGSYDQVGAELARYFQVGHRTVILEAPPSLDEMRHTVRALDAATQGVRVA